MSSAPVSSDALNSPGRILLASLIGTTIEFFDFYIYATAAVIVFPKLFFPGADPTSAIGEREAMWKLIGDLPLRQRAVVVLRYYEDLDDAAIGRILGCTASTVATHATRALDRLRMVVELAEPVSPRTS